MIPLFVDSNTLERLTILIWIGSYAFAGLLLNPVSLGLFAVNFFPKKIYSLGNSFALRFLWASVSLISIGFVLNWNWHFSSIFRRVKFFVNGCISNPIPHCATKGIETI